MNSLQLNTTVIEKIVSTNPEDRPLLVNKTIEEMSGCTIYNKNEILKRVVDMDNDSFIKEICKNIVPELSFEKFKAMGFSIIFVNDEVRVLYTNTIVDSSFVDKIPSESLNKPPFPELYIENLKTIIDKFNNIDVSVVYNCSNINSIYWNLFTLKAKKKYPDTKVNTNANKHIQDIISGAIYKDDDDIKAIMKEINMMEHEHKDSFSDSDEPYENNNDIFRLEVMSYLNDSQVNNFLNMDETVHTNEENIVDYDNKEQVVEYISNVLNINNTDMPTLGKIYFTNKLFKFLLNCKNFLVTYPKFMVVVKKKIIEIEQDSVLIKFTKINLTQDFIKTLKMTKEFLASLEKN
jgi:hypothetical protein